MQIYRTAEIAAIIGIHPNTVRLYEELQLIPKPERQANGYRIFTDFHIAQLRLARLAFQIEVLQNGLRKKIVEMVKVSATGDFDRAHSLTEEYLDQLQRERTNAEEAATFVRERFSWDKIENTQCFTRKEVSKYLDITIDTLRNWEMNGLLTVKRKENGYRVYTDKDIRQLKIIRSLRCANFSLEAILHMLNQLSKDPGADILSALDTPKEDTDIIAVCDRLISSLSAAAHNAKTLIAMLQDMKEKFL